MFECSHETWTPTIFAVLDISSYFMLFGKLWAEQWESQFDV